MDVGTVASGRIGLAVLRRLKPFDMRLHYTDRHRLPAEVEEELGLTRATSGTRNPRRPTTRGGPCRTTA
ncbi:NAD(P)-dependent oxidoreductase [Pseudonocardia sp. Cha107L01]|uniref:NAD(P)-dependent oxidoreductase n=1 Tax=Pseudonocardia sp. Cha107L01 TaxID=3457576 RepID=UPI00403EAE8E